MTGPIYVTRPFLPPLSEFLPMLEQIWESRILTNHGPFHQRLENRLSTFLESDHVSLVANGMLALTTAIQASGIAGEVITTPYSFVATTHALAMAGLTPVFVDIRPTDLTIDAAKIEAAITPRTSAIVGVHVYGNPCDVDAIARIAGRHRLKVIYDAAHAFGVRFRGKAVPAFGDFSTLSFHATKAFNTFEGGAVLTATPEDKRRIYLGSNFGIADEVTIPVLGGNAKMSEFNAALGLLQLDHFEQVLRAREKVDRLYRELLTGGEGIDPIQIPTEVEPNYSYFPVRVQPHFRVSRDALYEELKAQGILSRRYFYPLLSTLPMYRDLPSAIPDNLPVATEVADQILCLPLFPDLAEADQIRIAQIVKGASR